VRGTASSAGNELYFLKTSPAIYANTTYSVLREASRAKWLSGKLNVPEVILTAQDDSGIHDHPRRAGRTRRMIGTKRARCPLFQKRCGRQSVAIADCPFDSGAAVRLRELEFLINRLIDEDYDFEAWPGIATPQDLLTHLHATMPQEDLVFSHGDLGDSNILVDKNEQLHFIDLGRGGKADRWLDIAFAHRNLREEISDALATRLLHHDHPAKREFFEQLDELFFRVSSVIWTLNAKL
jgi:kanamycin kinase